MLLLIDAGNTQLKWALAPAGAALAHWQSAGSLRQDDADIDQQLAALSLQWRAAVARHAIVSNVAGETVPARITSALKQTGLDPAAVEWFQARDIRAGVRNGYREPARLGCDRFAALIGARHRFPDRALLVANCGTATTLDALTADGRFVGGMILPGLGTMARSLAVNTAQLPEVTTITLERLFADNTQEAIISGCVGAQVAAIERAQAHHPEPGALCVLSGGAAPYLAPHLRVQVERIDNLVLTGLHAAALSETSA